mgnify:CR=1|jgi:hypothetical protein
MNKNGIHTEFHKTNRMFNRGLAELYGQKNLKLFIIIRLIEDK